MLKIKNYILLCLLTLLSVSAMAQRPTINISVEPSDILIGEQAVINLEVISPLGRNIQFPVYGDTIIKGIEVLRMEKTDTLLNEVMTLRQKYVITSFDSTLYHIPYMEIVVDSDTVRSAGLGLKVTAPQLTEGTTQYLEQMKAGQTDSLNFEQLQISDIKDIQKPPFVWTDYLLYILIPLFGIMLIALAVLAYIFWKRKKQKGYFFTPKIIEPPHIVALRGLDELKSKKLSQKGMEKVYYTELTDIVRTYITERYKTINATEMITDDILDAVHRQTENTSPEQGLEQMLRLADLVKFAKYVPLPDENDLSMMNAYLFVNQTKVEEVEIPGDKSKAVAGARSAQPSQTTEASNNKTTNS